MLFNVYYLNFSKVYEIKMMLSNVIKTDETIETNQGDTVAVSYTHLDVYKRQARSCIGGGCKVGYTGAAGLDRLSL